MGYSFNWFRRQKKAPAERLSASVVVSTQDADKILTPPSGKTINIAKLPRLKSPVLSFKLRPGSVDFESSEYDMGEIGRIEDVEAYVQRANSQKEGLMFKADWELVGKNTQTIRYIRERFEQLSVASNTPYKFLFQGLGGDLVRYNNSFLVKVRNAKASGGSSRKLAGARKLTQPVAAYFPMPVSTVHFKRDEFGKVLRYRQQMPTGRYVDFAPDEVIHFHYRRKRGFLVGTPDLIPVKDDIRALRRIEENIEMLIYQHLFPLFHYKVGTENAPAREYPNGPSEITIVRQEVELMPAEGMIVTPERHEITAVGSESKALRAEGYLDHFKKRIFAGLGVSAIDMGEGDTANRSTADSMSRNLVDDVKARQRIMEVQVNELIIKELLLESTFSDPLSEENMVYLKFNEVDLDAQAKVENQAISLFSGHGITHSEFRRSLGKEPLTDEEWEDTYWKLMEEPKLLIQSLDEPYSAEAKAIARSAATSIQQPDLDEEQAAREKEIDHEAQAKAKATAAKAGQRSGPKSKSQSRGTRTAKAASKPSNQHGTKTGPEKRKSSFGFSERGFVFQDMTAPNNRVTSIYDDLADQAQKAIVENYFGDDWFRMIANAAATEMKEKLWRLTRMDFRSGFRSVDTELSTPAQASPLSNIEGRVERVVNRLANSLTSRVNEAHDINDTVEIRRDKVNSVFNALRFRSRFLYDNERSKAYSLGIARGLLADGYTQAEIAVLPGACENCQARKGLIELENLTLESVPGFHPSCRCRIRKVA